MTHTEQKGIFESWLSTHKGLLFKIVRAYARTPMDVDDLFQEIVIQVWHSIPAFKNLSTVSTWLYRISLNTALRWVGKERRHVHTGEIDNIPYIIADSGVQTDERQTWLYAAIYTLDEIDRSLTLLLLDGYSYKEMASIMGISESNVGVKINRIKKQLIAKSKKTTSHGI